MIVSAEIKFYSSSTLFLLRLITIKFMEDQLEIGMYDHISCNFHATHHD